MEHLILSKGHRSELLEKQSRFIAVALPCATLDEFRAQRSALENEFPDARHITYAYIISENQQILQRCHDANEPSGTAGRPILMHLTGRHLINIALFVIRYFGGIKLGAGGLMRAYGSAARQVLDEAVLLPYRPLCTLLLKLSYSDQKQLEYLLAKHGAELLDTQYSEHLLCSVQIAIASRDSFLRSLPPGISSCD